MNTFVKFIGLPRENTNRNNPHTNKKEILKPQTS